jgi:hypothetical protein
MSKKYKSDIFYTMGYCRSPHGMSGEFQRTREALRVQQRRQQKTRNRAKNRALDRARLWFAKSSVSSGFDNLDSSYATDKAAAFHAMRLAFKVNELTSGKGLEYQRAVLSKMLEQPLLQQTLPEYVINRVELQQCRAVCNGLKDAWSALKYGNGRDQYMARNVIEATVISVGDNQCLKGCSQYIGMNKRTLKRGVSRRTLLNEGVQGSRWAKSNRNRRKDALQQSVVDVVVAW